MDKFSLQCMVLRCEKVRKGCWLIELKVNWNGEVDYVRVQTNRPWPIGEVFSFTRVSSCWDVTLTNEPEEL